MRDITKQAIAIVARCLKGEQGAVDDLINLLARTGDLPELFVETITLINVHQLGFVQVFHVAGETQIDNLGNVKHYTCIPMS